MDAAGNFTSINRHQRDSNKQNEVTAFGSTPDLRRQRQPDDGPERQHAGLRRLEPAGRLQERRHHAGDADLRRRWAGVIVQNRGTATDLYYSDQWQVLEERVGGAAKVQLRLEPGVRRCLVLRDRDATGGGTLSERLWVQQDANWNVTALVNTSGSVVERYVYDPYGAATILGASWATLSASAYAWIYGYQGGRFDGTTGLYAFGVRLESPIIERWTTADPTGFSAGDVDFYRDRGNNPVNSLDPSGLATGGYWQYVTASYNLALKNHLDPNKGNGSEGDSTDEYIQSVLNPVDGPHDSGGSPGSSHIAEGSWYDYGLGVPAFARMVSAGWESHQLDVKESEQKDRIASKQDVIAMAGDPNLSLRDAAGNSTLASSRAATFDPALMANLRIIQRLSTMAATGVLIWNTSGAMWTTPAGESYVLSGGRWVNSRTGAFASGAEETAATRAFQAATNKISHIFGKATHNLGSVVAEWGSEGMALQAMQQAIEAHVFRNGITGVFEETVLVGTKQVTIRGVASGGKVMIGTAFIP